MTKGEYRYLFVLEHVLPKDEIMQNLLDLNKEKLRTRVKEFNYWLSLEKRATETPGLDKAIFKKRKLDEK